MITMFLILKIFNFKVSSDSYVSLDLSDKAKRCTKDVQVLDSYPINLKKNLHNSLVHTLCSRRLGPAVTELLAQAFCKSTSSFVLPLSCVSLGLIQSTKETNIIYLTLILLLLFIRESCNV